MSVVVQKFGGSSLKNAERVMEAARKAIRAKQAGNKVLVVVSAQGSTTDDLIAKAAEITGAPSAREMEMLLSTGDQESVALMAMAVHELGEDAISLTGAQIGVLTDTTHTKARIVSISTQRMQELLKAGNIVIAAGFQGVDSSMNIRTLGRGGSDTTATALAAVLNAELCEFYTDVEGVFTTDRRVVPSARKVERISYDEMLEMASLGAGVMHSRSIEFAKKYQVQLRVRPAYSDGPGTLIAPESDAANSVVTGVAFVRNEALVTLVGLPDQPGVMSSLFTSLSAARIPVDMVYLVLLGASFLYAQLKKSNQHHWALLALWILIISSYWTKLPILRLIGGLAMGLHYFALEANKQRFQKTLVILIPSILLGALFTKGSQYAVDNFLKPHQRERINVWLRPELCDPRGNLYHVMQSKLAISSCGFSGKGFLEGTLTKLNYVPEQSTDFIFSTIGEEQGFIGILAIIGLFVLFMFRVIAIGERARNAFTRDICLWFSWLFNHSFFYKHWYDYWPHAGHRRSSAICKLWRYILVAKYRL